MVWKLPINQTQVTFLPKCWTTPVTLQRFLVGPNLPKPDEDSGCPLTFKRILHIKIPIIVVKKHIPWHHACRSNVFDIP